MTLIVFALRWMLYARVHQPFSILSYPHWLLRIVMGNWGWSRSNREPVLRALAERLDATAILLVGVAIVTLAASFGIVALRQRSRLRSPALFVSALAYVTYAVPLIALLLTAQLFLAEHGWLPSAGMSNADRFDILDRVAHLVIPVTVVSLALLAPFSEDLVRYRSAMPDGRVAGNLFRLFCAHVPGLIGATAVAEVVFAWPGEGRAFYAALSQGDGEVVLGYLLFNALLVVLVRFFCDLLVPEQTARLSE